jgi:hypothetical protein
MTGDDPKPAISAEEMQRRREAVRQADANNRIEGIFRDPDSDAIVEAFIRGEIDAGDLVTAYMLWVERAKKTEDAGQ